MKLTVKERLVLFQILPKEGNFLTLKALREFKEAITFTESEQKTLQFKAVDGITTWTEPGVKDKTFYQADIDVPDIIADMIVASLKKMDTDRKLSIDTVGLYERFVIEGVGNDEAAKAGE